MMLMYALEHRHRWFLLAFAFGCLLSSAYGFLAGTWPFGVVEAVWAAIALRRFLRVRAQSRAGSSRAPHAHARQRSRQTALEESA
jgi:hypothetical protein